MAEVDESTAASLEVTILGEASLALIAGDNTVLTAETATISSQLDWAGASDSFTSHEDGLRARNPTAAFFIMNLDAVVATAGYNDLTLSMSDVVEPGGTGATQVYSNSWAYASNIAALLDSAPGALEEIEDGTYSFSYGVAVPIDAAVGSEIRATVTVTLSSPV